MIMEILDEIKTLIADSDPSNAYCITGISREYPAWVIRLGDNSFGVAVPYEGPVINENFANASIYSSELLLNGVIRKCLFLTSSISYSRNEFASFCASFVKPGNNGEDRRMLLEDPSSWWRRWKELIGNAINDQKPYTVLGEILMYEHLLKEGIHPQWNGPHYSSHDILTEKAEYEVKSTISRYDKIIHVSGQFQLQRTKRRLFLYFCRFEANDNGISINDEVDHLVKYQGVSRDELNSKLGSLGYAEGNSARSEKYQIHEVLQYNVDDSFPSITPESLKTGVLPAGIKHLSYDVDLSALNGNKVTL
jgi:hypothetical protein